MKIINSNFAMLVFGLLVSCASKPKLANVYSAPEKVDLSELVKDEIPKPARGGLVQVSQEGENDQVSIMETGDIFYVGKKYDGHLHSEVYLFQGQARLRKTFQDGIVQWPRASNKLKFIYASNTDEHKEKFWLKDSDPEVMFGTEVYLSDLKGSEIERLTDSSGPDTFPVFEGDNFYWVQKFKSINVKNWKTKAVKNIYTSKQGKIVYFSQLQGRLFWVEALGEDSLLWVIDKNEKGPKLMSQIPVIVTRIEPYLDGWLISRKSKKHEFGEIMYWDEKCQKLLLGSDQMDFSDAVASLDFKKMAFTVRMKEGESTLSHVFLMDVSWERSIPCQESKE